MVQKREIVIGLEGYSEFTITKEDNGEVVIRLIPREHTKLQENTRLPQNEVEETSEGKYTYFTVITEKEREKVKKWFKKCNFTTSKRKRKFAAIVQQALREINYDYSIANIEPSVKEGKIYYAEGDDVGEGFSAKQWDEMANEFSQERGSRLATLQELFLWYAVRIVNGLWTLDYITKNSSSAGNYWDSPNALRKKAKAGEIECGGYKDGQGNTRKIATFENGYAMAGGSCYDHGMNTPVGGFLPQINSDVVWDKNTGVVVLTK